jgi:hypothetical protein
MPAVIILKSPWVLLAFEIPLFDLNPLLDLRLPPPLPKTGKHSLRCT